MTGVDLQSQWLGFFLIFFLKIENDYVAQSAWSQTHYYRVQANTEPFVLIFEILGLQMCTIMLAPTPPVPQETVSLCCPGWPGTSNILVLAFCVLRLQACTQQFNSLRRILPLSDRRPLWLSGDDIATA